MNEVTEDKFEGCAKPYEYKRMLFGLAFFHAIILERRKFGAIGWNIPYEWMNSDFETSQMQLRNFLDEQPEVPYTAISVIISEINYGGRVTDDKDKRLIAAILNKYMNPKIMDQNYYFDEFNCYHPPNEDSLQGVRQCIASLPSIEAPEVFGLHSNSNITFE
mmetsp:Transcript_8280/g.4426  ORF Transcript_8280/g.4426 Transcript_8280/m.4426 type:complete len:162 (+) Transcript_8280:1040-1525(+)|eukprot:CAMPEP_0201285946 /NCGR_PEP_ID=MMETSP1317-20130820/114056_1 /ASSEMBLY_ACC=CAM_ASM_000770 /TAXON_ID=187299 /ORGANISM="Undescribed Undescribed, Strain Undescribed" /LENGTH=161 /DNA_ID=CAMNT_0047612205 /DNA_START=1983 /DNA_END=2468 /DNA_ORIENTATION=+